MNKVLKTAARRAPGVAFFLEGRGWTQQLVASYGEPPNLSPWSPELAAGGALVRLRNRNKCGFYALTCRKGRAGKYSHGQSGQFKMKIKGRIGF